MWYLCGVFALSVSRFEQPFDVTTAELEAALKDAHYSATVAMGLLTQRKAEKEEKEGKGKASLSVIPLSSHSRFLLHSVETIRQEGQTG